MAPREDRAGPGTERVRNTLLAVITVLLVIAGLRWSAPVTMPLAFAGFLIALCWPLREWLNRQLPQHPSFAFIGTTVALLLILAAFTAALFFTGRTIANAVPQYADELDRLLGQVQSLAKSHGLPAPGQMFSGSSVGSYLQGLIMSVYSGLGLLLFILALVVLGLPAVPRLGESMETAFGGERGKEILAVAGNAAHRVQRYPVTATLTSAITGVLTGLFALAVGLDLAFLWAMIAFLLNYIPTVGSVVAVIPPVLFAVLQFDGLLMPLVVLVGLTILQIAMGSFVFPHLAGRYVMVMPVVILAGLAFWGWIWGIPGALLATPLTTTILIVCGEFRSTRWITILLSRESAPEPVGAKQEGVRRDEARRASAPHGRA
jgi:AI-2 transport protein TqsA